MIQKDYPYMYARISAKKAKLLEKEDYDRLVKMGPNEIARNLEEGEYKREINELGADYEGVKLIEIALMKNVSRTMSDLIDIAPETLKPLLRAFLRRYDILSLKRLLRWKKGGEEGRLEDLLVPVGSYSIEDLRELAEKDIEQIGEEISFPGSDVDYSKYLQDTGNIRKIERDLDWAYYTEMRNLAEETGSQWFKRFIEKEIEYENLSIALRMKRYGSKEEDIRNWLVTEDPSECVERVLNADNLEKAIKEVEEREGMEFEATDLEEVSHALEVERLKTALRTLHIEPLGLTSIMGYIVAKMIEVKNLRMLIRAKEAEIQNLETIRSNLVVA